MERKKLITIISIITLLFLMTFVIATEIVTTNGAKLTSSESLEKLNLGSGATYSLREVYYNETIFYLEDSVVPIHYTENNTDVLMVMKESILMSQSQQFYSHQEICIKSECAKTSDLNVWCYEEGLDIICKSTLDGDGAFKQKGITAGQSFLKFNSTSAYLEGHLKDDFRKDVNDLKNAK